MTKLFLHRLWLVVFVASVLSTTVNAQSGQGELVLNFKNRANHKALVLQDSTYTNSFEETYQLTRLRYYISNINLSDGPKTKQQKNVFLVDASVNESISIKIKPGTYTGMAFKLGVDSALNCSGAQDGALDPMKGMFWTWNSGYIFFKMEGYSTASTADLQRIEHHIGGYLGAYQAAREIAIPFNVPMVIKAGESISININVDLDKYWQGVNELKIATHALIMQPGELAKKSADNIAGMFSIIQ